MTYWTDPIAVGFFYASVLFALAWVTRAVWRMWWRRDDLRQEQRGATLAAAIVDEQRTESRCDHSALDRQVPIVVEPTLRELSIPMHPDQTIERYPLAPGGWVEFRGQLVHIRCVGPYLRNGAVPCAGCAVHLRDDVQAGAV